MELTHAQIESLVYRFPKLELSYETVAHKKVSPNYDICIAIPTGKKQFAWFTYCGEEDVCYLIDLNKDKKVSRMLKIEGNFNYKLAFGTLIYGTLCTIDEKQVFIIEDIYYYCGLPIKHYTFGEKLTHLQTLMSDYIWKCSSSIIFALPYMILVEGNNDLLESLQFYESIITKTAYATHHIQFRASDEILPYLNHTYKKKQEQIVYEPDIILFPRTDLNYMAQSTLKTAVFRITADIQNDVYHLFAYDGKTRGYTYVNIAYIGTRTLSAYMNRLFRNIRENDNIDYGEESEDEDTFQNVNPDKYVDLKKEYKMKCVFHTKFKKWVPEKVVDKEIHCVNINDLLYLSKTDIRPGPNENKRFVPKNGQKEGYRPGQKEGYQTNRYVQKKKY